VISPGVLHNKYKTSQVFYTEQPHAENRDAWSQHAAIFFVPGFWIGSEILVILSIGIEFAPSRYW